MWPDKDNDLFGLKIEPVLPKYEPIQPIEPILPRYEPPLDNFPRFPNGALVPPPGLEPPGMQMQPPLHDPVGHPIIVNPMGLPIG